MKYSDLRHGQYYSAIMDDIKIIGRVVKFKDRYYLVYDDLEGAGIHSLPLGKRMGYMFAYLLNKQDKDNEVYEIIVKNLIIITKKEYDYLDKTRKITTIAGYKIIKKSDGEYRFGCGVISLTKKEALDFIKLFKFMKENKIDLDFITNTVVDVMAEIDHNSEIDQIDKIVARAEKYFKQK